MMSVLPKDLVRRPFHNISTTRIVNPRLPPGARKPTRNAISIVPPLVTIPGRAVRLGPQLGIVSQTPPFHQDNPPNSYHFALVLVQQEHAPAADGPRRGVARRGEHIKTHNTVQAHPPFHLIRRSGGVRPRADESAAPIRRDRPQQIGFHLGGVICW